jgi:hypothetical protein
MSIVTIPAELQVILSRLTERTELRDATGVPLGMFTPKQVLEEGLYARADKEFNPEEIQRDLCEQRGGFTIEEVRSRLRALENA